MSQRIQFRHGLFTEIAPLEDSAKSKPVLLLDNADFCSSTGFTNQLFHIYPMYGDYVEIQVTNHEAQLAQQILGVLVFGVGGVGQIPQRPDHIDRKSVV